MKVYNKITLQSITDPNTINSNQKPLSITNQILYNKILSIKIYLQENTANALSHMGGGLQMDSYIARNIPL